MGKGVNTIFLQLENVIANVNSDWMGVYINGEYFNQLQFASDILLTTESSDESQEMQNDQKK